MPQQINEIQGTTQSSIEALRQEIAELKTKFRNRQRGSRNSRTRYDRSKLRTQQQHDTCCYHFKFGTKARNCRPPYKAGIEANEASGQKKHLTSPHKSAACSYKIVKKKRFLINTGADVCIYPNKSLNRTLPTEYKLYAAYGNTYGMVNLNFALGLRRNFS